MATHSSVLAGKSRGQRSLLGHSLWGCKELDMTEQQSMTGNTRVHRAVFSCVRKFHSSLFVPFCLCYRLCNCFSLCQYLEKEMATHSSVLAWRIPGMGEPPGLSSVGSHRVGHD